jgi:hypothetical protein
MFTITAPNIASPIRTPRKRAPGAIFSETSTGSRRSVRRTTRAYAARASAVAAKPATRVSGAFQPSASRPVPQANETSATRATASEIA